MNVNTEDIRNQLAGNKSGTAELRSRLLFVMFALLAVSIFVVVTGGTAVAPFIYAIF